MLKKILIILMILAICCGIGYVGYLIFVSRNIESVEFQGSMQTIYFVGDDVDFENSELKVVYKNGDIKVIKLNDADVSLTLFSTAQGGHKKMKINYKNASPIEIEYDVFEKMLYYVDSEVMKTAGNSGQRTNFSTSTTKQAIYFLANGKLRYYHRESASDDWFMNDGMYDTDYYYTIEGDKIIAHLGDEKMEISAGLAEDKIFLKSSDQVNDQTNPEIVSRIYERTFAQQTLARRTISQISVAYSKSKISTNYYTFTVGDNLATANFKTYLEVTYNAGVDFLSKVYVEMCDEMINGSHKLNTSRTFMEAPGYYEVAYGSPELDGKNENVIVYYKVSA